MNLEFERSEAPVGALLREPGWPRPPRPLSREEWPPDYVEVLAWRQRQLLLMRQNPELVKGAKEYYRTHCVEFICHWCVTHDPRLAGQSGKLTLMPFVLFERQEQFVRFVLDCLDAQESGLIEKSREMGATWLCCAISVWLWLYRPGAAIGWGSRERDLVDKIGDPSSIFEKMRMLINYLPPELLPRWWQPERYMNFMRIVNPENGSTITGDIGDNIGRGGRNLIFFKDESAHYTHPEMIEAALSETTRVQIDVSSVNAWAGGGHVFQRRREAGIEWQPGVVLPKGRVRVFVLDWREHPEKDLDWYDLKRKKAEDEGLMHVFAQEIDRDYTAAVEGVIIPGPWVQAAIDAHKRLLRFPDGGPAVAGLDVADGGGDTNALAIRRGPMLVELQEWSERDTGVTARRAVTACAEYVPINLQYDAVGVGSGIKAETNRLRDENLVPEGLTLTPWNGGAEVRDPEANITPGDKRSPKNKDLFGNYKAQAWWQLRLRFEKTWRAQHDPSFSWNPDDLISLPSTLPLLHRLVKELSQPTISQNSRLKMLVDKKPDGAKSPNLADSVVQVFWPAKGLGPLNIPDKAMAWSQTGQRRLF